MNITSHQEEQRGFIRKHLRGEYSLARSYWINTLLMSMLAPTLSAILIPLVVENFAAKYGSMGALFFIVLGVFIWLWSISGTWASANKHVSRGGKQGWAVATRVVIVLGAISIVSQFISSTTSLQEHWRMAFGAQFGPEAIFQVRSDGKSLLVRGGFNDGIADALLKELNKAPTVTTVVLHSPGGLIRQGKLMAKIIAERKLNTYVEQECTSACTIAFLAGKDRTGEPNAKLGFHAFRSIGVDNALSKKFDDSNLKKTYQRAGLSSSFIERIAATPHTSVWHPTQQELMAEKIFTRLSFGGETAAFITTITTKEQLISEFKKIPAFNTLSTKYPSDFDGAINAAWAQLLAKKTDSEVLSSGRAKLTELFGRLLPMAPDALLIAFNELLYDEVSALKKANPRACVELTFPSGASVNVVALLTPALVERELALTNDVIRDSDSQHLQKLSPMETSVIDAKMRKLLTPEQRKVFIAKDKHSLPAEESCAAIVSYFGAINAIPKAERIRLLRFLYS